MAEQIRGDRRRRVRAGRGRRFVFDATDGQLCYTDPRDVQIRGGKGRWSRAGRGRGFVSDATGDQPRYKDPRDVRGVQIRGGRRRRGCAGRGRGFVPDATDDQSRYRDPRDVPIRGGRGRLDRAGRRRGFFPDTTDEQTRYIDPRDVEIEEQRDLERQLVRTMLGVQSKKRTVSNDISDFEKRDEKSFGDPNQGQHCGARPRYQSYRNISMKIEIPGFEVSKSEFTFDVEDIWMEIEISEFEDKAHRDEFIHWQIKYVIEEASIDTTAMKMKHI